MLLDNLGGVFRPIADPIKTLFFAKKEFFLFFAAKLGHFTISDTFIYVTKHSN
jgi:hypothetical protein